MPSDLCICPYNKSHVIQRLKFPHHLVKCKKNYPHIQLKTCPFNATHLCPKEQFEQHLRECADKKVIEPWRYNIGNNQHGDLTPAPFNDYSTECSDDEDGWN